MSKNKVITPATNDDVFLEFCELNKDNPNFHYSENITQPQKQNETTSEAEKTYLSIVLIAVVYAIAFFIFRFFAVSNVTNKFVGLLFSATTIIIPMLLKKTSYYQSTPFLQNKLTPLTTLIGLLIVSPTHFLPLIIVNIFFCFIRKTQKYTYIITDYVFAEFLMPTPIAIIFTIGDHFLLKVYEKYTFKFVNKYMEEDYTIPTN